MKKVIYILEGMSLFCLDLQGIQIDMSQQEQKGKKAEIRSVSEATSSNGSVVSRFSRRFFGYFGFGTQKSEEEGTQKDETKDSSYIENEVNNEEEFKNQWSDINNESTSRLDVQSITSDREFLVNTTHVWKDSTVASSSHSNSSEKQKDTDILETIETSSKEVSDYLNELKLVKETYKDNKNFGTIIDECINRCDNNSRALESVKALYSKAIETNPNSSLYCNYKRELEERPYSEKLLSAINSLKSFLPNEALVQIQNAPTFEQKIVATTSALIVASNDQFRIFGKNLKEIGEALFLQQQVAINQQMEIQMLKAQVAQLQKSLEKPLTGNDSKITENIKAIEGSSVEKNNVLKSEIDKIEKKTSLESNPRCSNESPSDIKNIKVSGTQTTVGNLLYTGDFDSETLAADGNGTLSKDKSLTISGKFQQNFLDTTVPISIKSISTKILFQCSHGSFLEYDILHLSNLKEIQFIKRSPNKIIAFTDQKKSRGYVFCANYIYRGELDSKGEPFGKGNKLAKDGNLVTGTFDGINSVSFE